jgi:heme/copper-type cytochrome/quinol oxidase subunit 2
MDSLKPVIVIFEILLVVAVVMFIALLAKRRREIKKGETFEKRDN